MRVCLSKWPALRGQGVRAAGSRSPLCAARWERSFESQALLQSPQPISCSTMLWSPTSRSKNRRQASAHFWRLKPRDRRRDRFARELPAKRPIAPREIVRTRDAVRSRRTMLNSGQGLLREATLSAARSRRRRVTGPRALSASLRRHPKSGWLLTPPERAANSPVPRGAVRDVINDQSSEPQGRRDQRAALVRRKPNFTCLRTFRRSSWFRSWS